MKQQWLERPEAGTAFGYKIFSTFARLCGRGAARLVLYPITLFFLIEYAYRRQRFPRQPYRNMFDFIRRTLAAMPVIRRSQ